MKHWIAQYKIVEALRRHKTLSRFWRNRISSSTALRQFEHTDRQLDRHLRDEATSDRTSVPPDLHQSIMQAVREDSRAAAPTSPPWRSLVHFILLPRRLAPVVAGAALIALVWWAARPPLQEPLLIAIPKASPTRQNASVSIPTPEALLADLHPYGPGPMRDPLAEQLEALSNEARNTARFLVASLP